MLLNRFNFLFFQPDTRPEPSMLPGQPVSGAGAIASAASVVVVPGEGYRLYIPFEVDPNLSNLGVDLVSETGVLKRTNFGTVQSLAGIFHKVIVFALDASVTATAVPDGYYLLRLNGNAGAIYSNRVWIRRTNYTESSALFTWANTRAVGPIDYERTDLVGFTQQLRVKCLAQVAQPDTSVEEYEQVTTGKKVPVNIKTHSALPFTCRNTDGFGHEGWKTLLSHRKILLNGQAVSVKTGYALSDGAGTLANGKFELWDTAYSVINRC